MFGDGHARPLDRNAKARIMVRARALMRRTEPGKHYGPITAKALAVLEALLWHFHNARGGLCFPSYEAIAGKADCAPSTVGVAIKALEDTGILSWVNRITRIRDRAQDLFGHWVTRWRVIRTSNSYRFHDGVVARFVQNRTLSGKAQLFSCMHKPSFAKEGSPQRQFMDNSVSKPSFKIVPKGKRDLERALACDFGQIVRRPHVPEELRDS